MVWPEIRRYVAERMAPELGQCTVPPAGKWSVKKGRHTERCAQPPGEGIALGHDGFKVVTRELAGAVGDEWHHIEDAQSRMDPLV